VLEGDVERGRQLAGVGHAHDPNRGAEPVGLYEHRPTERPEAVEHLLAPFAPLVLADPRVAHLRNPGAGHQILEQDLIHAQRRREHPSADVRNVEALEQTLHGAVLAERAVQHGEHNVAIAEAPARR
jgi:hypothetical protein